MASIDEAYLDLTGTERLPVRLCAPRTRCTKRSAKRRLCAARSGIASSRLVAKVSSDQAKPNGIL